MLNFSPRLEHCQKNKNTILSKGARTSIYLLLTNSHQLIMEMNEKKEKTEATIKPLIQSTRMVQSEEVMINTALVFNDIINSYEQSMTKYIAYIFLVNIASVVGSAVFLIFLYIVVWNPYLNNLNNNIWRTKGMLGMIPMRAIQNNNALEKAIIEGDLIQAVK